MVEAKLTANDDVVVGHITRYNYDAIKPWINSLNKCGFTGKKLLFIYDLDFDVAQQIKDNDIVVAFFKKDEEKKKYTYIDGDYNVVVDRFNSMDNYFSYIADMCRYIITTDVKDVIFQKNPSEWLENNITDKSIMVSTESIQYCYEGWGWNNMLQSFGPKIANIMKYRLIYNCGVLAGKRQDMIDLFRNIYLICAGMPSHIPGGGGPDQAALNVILSLGFANRDTRFCMSEEGWAAQLGTTGPQVADQFGQYLTEPSPKLIDGLVCTSKGEPFTIVHQYDRVSQWKDKILERYV